MSVTNIDIHDLLDRFAEVLAQAATGAEVIVTECNVPRARLLPLPTPKSRVLGLHAGAIRTTADFDAPLPDDFWVGTP